MKRLLAVIAMALIGGSANGADPLLINGAGATFPYPLYSKWFSEYNKIHPDLRFNYQSIGSGGGIQQVTKGTVDFGASDAPMTDEELSKAPDIVHIPAALGAVVLVFNAQFAELRLTPETLSAIFLGKISKWNAPEIVKDNPSVKLPDLPIAVVHRSDGSGTTAIFTNYLAKVSDEWKKSVGEGKNVKWPTGIGGKGNEGVTGLVKQTPGAIGYVELAYANQNKLSQASLRNKDGLFVRPTVSTTSQAAAGASIPDDFRVSITDAAGKDSYPIASFTYLLVHKDQANKAKGEALLRFIWWATHDGQAMSPALDYAQLPKSVVSKIEEKLKSLTVQGKRIGFADAR